MINEDVQPSEYPNDGYIWLALTHHLLGAGRLEQVRCCLVLQALGRVCPCYRGSLSSTALLRMSVHV